MKARLGVVPIYAVEIDCGVLASADGGHVHFLGDQRRPRLLLGAVHAVGAACSSRPLTDDGVEQSDCGSARRPGREVSLSPTS